MGAFPPRHQGREQQGLRTQGRADQQDQDAAPTKTTTRTKPSAAKRPVVDLELCLGNVKRTVEVNLTDRSSFNYPLLIGAKALREFGAAVNPARVLPRTNPTADFKWSIDVREPWGTVRPLNCRAGRHASYPDCRRRSGDCRHPDFRLAGRGLHHHLAEPWRRQALDHQRADARPT